MKESAKENCEVVMSNKQNKILRLCYGQKLIKLLFIVFLGFETIFEKASTCDNNPEVWYTTKKQKDKSLCFLYCCKIWLQ